LPSVDRRTGGASRFCRSARATGPTWSDGTARAPRSPVAARAAFSAAGRGVALVGPDLACRIAGVVERYVVSGCCIDTCRAARCIGIGVAREEIGKVVSAASDAQKGGDRYAQRDLVQFRHRSSNCVRPSMRRIRSGAESVSAPRALFAGGFETDSLLDRYPGKHERRRHDGQGWPMMETHGEGPALRPWLPVALLQPGQIFAGRYRVVTLLGGGCTSQVHEAVSSLDGRKVAIKVFDRQLLPSPGAVKHFEFVMSAERRVSGPHVLTTLEAGVDAETQLPFVVTELLSGESLESAVKRRGRMGTRRLLECMRQLAVGLATIHGNLKPGGIFVERQANGSPLVTILDFGLAEALRRSRDANGRGGLGPPTYTAYEQICGFPVTPRSDVWAFALIAFFLMTGHHYWYAANADLDDARRRRELFDEILNRRVVPPSFRARELGVDVQAPPRFDAWFATCLEREPEARFAGAQAAFHELERAFRPEGAGHPWVTRMRWAIASLVLGLALVITLAWIRPF
jgi:hypothetical protein